MYICYNREQEDIMEQHIRESINDKVLAEAAKRYDLDFADLHYHGGFENFVYIYEKAGKEYVLRLAHSDHKAYDQVLAEIEFIDYLANNGGSVSTVVHSHQGNIAEKVMIDAKDYFTVAAFTRGKGERIREKAADPNVWVNLGEQIGRFHRLTKDFNPRHRREEWYEDLLFSTIPDKVLKDDNIEILGKMKDHIAKIRAIPKTRDNYGLIHTDAHFGNMVLSDDGHLTIFDFDDASYKHFISDIAIVIFYQFAYANPEIRIRNEKTVWILDNFLEGYLRQNQLAKADFLMLEDFIRLRVYALYAVIMAGGPDVYNSPWGSNYLKIYREKLLKDEPIVDIGYVMENCANIKALA